MEISVGVGEGLGDVHHVKLKFPQNPHFWNLSALGNTVGHEFGHMLTARLIHIAKPTYGWGSPDREPVNFIHYADGLNKFYSDPTYIQSHWITDWKKARLMRIALFDIERLNREREKVIAFVAANRLDKRWDFA